MCGSDLDFRCSHAMYLLMPSLLKENFTRAHYKCGYDEQSVMCGENRADGARLQAFVEKPCCAWE